MVDQRGTGRSTPVGTLPGLSQHEQAEYLTHFRADSIARDAEWIRREPGVERWSVLGQSFGGVCVATYLSLADGGATRWAAERLLPDAYAAPDELTGEHIYPGNFQDHAALAPLREAADILVAHEWPRLYDPERLAANEVPAAGAIYANDIYVERTLSEETAGKIRGLRPWVTSEYEHNGLRADGGRILTRSIDLARGRA
jgi:pimeloyl-ACP methyl ester carboxylesterase